LLESLETAVICLDEKGRIVQMNAAAEQSMLIGRNRARGRYFGEVVAIPPVLHDAIRRQPGAGDSRHLHELRIGQGLFDCTLQTIEDGNLLLELHNLEWERKRMRLQQREVQTGMLELLSRNLGHEIRNPLGGIRGAAQMLATEVETPELETLARLVMREADRIDELILRFGQPELDEENIDIYPLLDEVLALLAVEFGEEVLIERDYDPSIPTIRGDASAIRQIMLNLVRNACQAQSSRIVLRTRVEYSGALLQSGSNSCLRLDVTDDGAGVPESLRSLLFLPLVTGRRNGTGLGLALSQQLASAHGGLLAYEPLSGQDSGGSRFTLFLPLEKNGE
jgi:two-component system nitrogen regulation sensor histidine kinase GlnL